MRRGSKFYEDDFDDGLDEYDDDWYDDEDDAPVQAPKPPPPKPKPAPAGRGAGGRGTGGRGAATTKGPGSSVAAAAAAAAALRSAPRPLPTLPLDGSAPWRDEADDHAKKEAEHKAKLSKKAESKANKAKAKAKASAGGAAGASQAMAGLSLGGSQRAAPKPSAAPPAAAAAAAPDAKPWAPSAALRARSSWLPPSLTVAVMGHVDAGKSTLVGRLLFETGAVSDKAARAALRGAKEAGKASFGWAWLLDERSAERARGVTSETARVTVRVPPDAAPRSAGSSGSAPTSLTLVDTPGHAELVSTALDGAAGADALLLVVDGASGPEAAQGERRPERALAAIARAVGAREVVVAVTKLDALRGAAEGGADAEARFEALATECVSWLKAVGFAPSRIAVVPVVGPTGENVVSTGPGRSLERPAKGAKEADAADAGGVGAALGWYRGPTVLGALCAAADRSAAHRAEMLALPPRAMLLDAATLVGAGGGSSSAGDSASSFAVRVRVLSGGLEPGMRLRVQPLGVEVQVTQVQPRADAQKGGRGARGDGSLAAALPGEEADASLRLLPPAKAAALAAGDVLCADPSVDPSPTLPATKFAAKILVLDPPGPVVPGTPVVAHVGGVSRPGRVTALAAAEPGARKPRFLRKGDRGCIEVALEAPLCVEVRSPAGGKGEAGAPPAVLSRVVLRGSGKTVGAGVVEGVLEVAAAANAEG